MRQYVVQPGDSPASIAARFAGCPKCSRDLTSPEVNPHKTTAIHPNGFVTFRDLRVGETINLPDKWFSAEFDARPQAYFAALPYADGVTPSTLGAAAAGVLGDYAALDTATSKVGALASMSDQDFTSAVGDVGAAIDAAVQEAYGSPNAAAAAKAQDVQNGTHWAWQRNQDMPAAIASGDVATIANVRNDVQNALSTALGNAQLTLQLYHGGHETVVPSGFSPALATAAQAAAAAIAADSNYCASVARAGSLVNSAVHAFKTAWNASQPSPVPINTGNYEAATAAALAQVVGTAPAACGARAAAPPPPPPPPPPQPIQRVAQQPTAPAAGGMSTGAVVGVGLAAAAAIGTIVFVATRPSGGSTRAVHEVGERRRFCPRPRKRPAQVEASR